MTDRKTALQDAMTIVTARPVEALSVAGSVKGEAKYVLETR
jgi:hypothetical protein